MFSQASEVTGQRNDKVRIVSSSSVPLQNNSKLSVLSATDLVSRVKPTILMRSDDSNDCDNNDNDIMQVQIVCARNYRTRIKTDEMEWNKCRRRIPKKYP
jgi:hypothetical protein